MPLRGVRMWVVAVLVASCFQQMPAGCAQPMTCKPPPELGSTGIKWPAQTLLHHLGARPGRLTLGEVVIPGMTDSTWYSYRDAARKCPLRNRYGTDTRPNEELGDCYGPATIAQPEEVTVFLALESVWDIDQMHTQLEIKGSLEVEYMDCRLTYPKDASATVSLKVTEKSILESKGSDSPLLKPWVPHLFDELMVFRHGTIYDENFMVYIVYPDGKVQYRVPFNYKVKCSMDFSFLPFDRHDCKLRLLSFRYTESELKLVANDESFRQQGALSTHMYSLGVRKWQSQVITHSFISHSEVFNHSMIEFTFSVDRRPYWYFMHVMLPANLFWLLSYMGFYIDPAAVPARAAIHVIPILILANNIRSVAESLPKVDYNTWMGQFVSFKLILVVAHFVVFALQDYYRAKYKIYKSRKEKMGLLEQDKHLEIEEGDTSFTDYEDDYYQSHGSDNSHGNEDLDVLSSVYFSDDGMPTPPQTDGTDLGTPPSSSKRMPPPIPFQNDTSVLPSPMPSQDYTCVLPPPMLEKKANGDRVTLSVATQRRHPPEFKSTATVAQKVGVNKKRRYRAGKILNMKFWAHSDRWARYAFILISFMFDIGYLASVPLVRAYGYDVCQMEEMC